MDIISVIVLIFNLIVLIGVSVYIGMLQDENQKRYIKMQEEAIKRFKQHKDIINQEVDKILKRRIVMEEKERYEIIKDCLDNGLICMTVADRETYLKVENMCDILNKKIKEEKKVKRLLELILELQDEIGFTSTDIIDRNEIIGYAEDYEIKDMDEFFEKYPCCKIIPYGLMLEVQRYYNDEALSANWCCATNLNNLIKFLERELELKMKRGG